MFKVLLMLIAGIFLSIDAFAQQITVKGIVKDTTGEPVIGANVVEKGTTNGTITDMDGNFSLEKVPVQSQLQISYIGYETKELVDVVTGDITTIQSLRHTSDLDTGEMYVFLCKVEAWAMNIGCHLTIPQRCEFQLLRDKQEA